MPRLRTPRLRGFVEREAISWHISGSALAYWRHSGVPIIKAHVVKVQEQDPWGRIFHLPVCGAPVGHASTDCEMAPQGWPMCHKCVKRLDRDYGLPGAFAKAFAQDAGGGGCSRHLAAVR